MSMGKVKSLLQKYSFALIIVAVMLFQRIYCLLSVANPRFLPIAATVLLVPFFAVYLNIAYQKSQKSDFSLALVCLIFGAFAMLPPINYLSSATYATLLILAALTVDLFTKSSSPLKFIAAAAVLLSAIADASCALFYLPFMLLIFLIDALASDEKIIGGAAASIAAIGFAVGLMINKNISVYVNIVKTDVLFSLLKIAPVLLLFSLFFAAAIRFSEKEKKKATAAVCLLSILCSLMPFVSALTLRCTFTQADSYAAVSVGILGIATLKMLLSDCPGIKKAADEAGRLMKKYFIPTVLLLIYVFKILQPAIDIR